jgi:peptidoglycan/xylan/chitin deacetylase (PgdA/CDA1 family)
VFQPTAPPHDPNAVALTFDDGPWPDNTPKVLEVLAKARIKATFFLVGRQVRKHPELVGEELRAGMALGSHSYSHPQPFGALSSDAIRQEIDQGVAALADLGVKTTLFRPPGGAIPPAVVSAARAKGLHTVVWTVDPDDWKRGTTADQITQRVLAEAKPWWEPGTCFGHHAKTFGFGVPEELLDRMARSQPPTGPPLPPNSPEWPERGRGRQRGAGVPFRVALACSCPDRRRQRGDQPGAGVAGRVG